jgi:hypothetical protein
VATFREHPSIGDEYAPGWMLGAATQIQQRTFYCNRAATGDPCMKGEMVVRELSPEQIAKRKRFVKHLYESVSSAGVIFRVHK